MSDHRLLKILENGRVELYSFDTDSTRSDVEFPEGDIGKEIRKATIEDFGRNEIIVQVENGRIVSYKVNSPG